MLLLLNITKEEVMNKSYSFIYKKYINPLFIFTNLQLQQ